MHEHKKYKFQFTFYTPLPLQKKGGGVNYQDVLLKHNPQLNPINFFKWGIGVPQP